MKKLPENSLEERSQGIFRSLDSFKNQPLDCTVTSKWSFNSKMKASGMLASASDCRDNITYRHKFIFTMRTGT